MEAALDEQEFAGVHFLQARLDLVACNLAGDFQNAVVWLEKSLSLHDESPLGLKHAMRDEDRARILFYLGLARARLNRNDTLPVFPEAMRLDPTQGEPAATA